MSSLKLQLLWDPAIYDSAAESHKKGKVWVQIDREAVR
jgi:hypothetical protein